MSGIYVNVEIDDDMLEDIFNDMGEQERLDWARTIIQEEGDQDALIELALDDVSNERMITLFKEFVDGNHDVAAITSVMEHAMNRLNALKAIAQQEAA